MPRRKPKLTKRTLSLNYVYYYEDPADDDARQDIRNKNLHASIVTDGLLDFNYILSPSNFVHLCRNIYLPFPNSITEAP